MWFRWYTNSTRTNGNMTYRQNCSTTAERYTGDKWYQYSIVENILYRVRSSIFRRPECCCDREMSIDFFRIMKWNVRLMIFIFSMVDTGDVPGRLQSVHCYGLRPFSWWRNYDAKNLTTTELLSQFFMITVMSGNSKVNYSVFSFVSSNNFQFIRTRWVARYLNCRAGLDAHRRWLSWSEAGSVIFGTFMALRIFAWVVSRFELSPFNGSHDCQECHL